MNTCPGSGQPPARLIRSAQGRLLGGKCPKCKAQVRIGKNGKLRGHYRPEDADAITRNLWSLFN